MSQNHLTDEQIQNYLEHRMTDNDSAAAMHLEHCAQCRREVALYRDLYVSLREDHVPKLSDDFAGRVISNLSAAGRSRWDRIESGFMAAIILITLAISIYFVNPLPLLIETGSSIWHRLFSNNDLLTKLSAHGPLILIAIVIFLLVELFDKKLLKHKV